MGTTIGSNDYSSLFSSLNGSYNAAANMSSIIAQRSQIQNGSYAKLMKAYVKKVGNKTALDAYRSTGTTATASDLSTAATSPATSTSTAKTSTSKKTGFLDSHLSSIGKAGTSRATAAGTSYLDKYLSEKTEPEKTGVEKAKAYAESVTGLTLNEDGTTSPKTENDAAVSSGAEAGSDGAEANAAAAEENTDKYAGMKSTWLDDHLKQYDQDANVQTAADTSVAVDETV